MPNQLIHSQNPYLRQHAENPVDWMPWGEAAFAKARAEDKPIFLSIGYSTCHWCHVMAHESFEHPQIAAYLNEHFVSIKVDREERPDVDHLYMSFVQATTGSGGWPLTVFLTPELKPFFGGTYFPPVEVQGHVAFPTLLGKIAAAWKNQRERIEESGNEVMTALTEFATLTKSTFQESSWDEHAKKCFADLRNAYDPEYGGFGGAPLFPRPVTHDFLHQYYAIHKDETALEMSARTLSKMAAGGMHDQLGGGFHRYSVDHYWMVPHFEKMLYDQAQLAISFLEMSQLSGDEFYAETARDIFDYVLRDLRHPQGGFFAAEDADSLDSPESKHAHEGLFYIWAEAEIDAALGEESPLFKKRYDVRTNGNAPAEGDPSGEFKDTNILHIAQTLETLSAEFKLDKDKIKKTLDRHKKVLFDLRELRPHPHRDEKIIPAWNGMMISALARGGRVLNEKSYIDAAKDAAAFVRNKLYNEESGILARHYCDGVADVDGFAGDYAAMIGASIDLYEATFDFAHLQFAEKLVDHLQKYFWDESTFGYYDAGPDPHLLLRFKSDHDGAEPAPNSMIAGSLLKLSHLLGRDDFAKNAEQIFEAYQLRVKTSPTVMPKMLAVKVLSGQAPQHIILVGEEDDANLQELLNEVNSRYLPGAVVILLNQANREFWNERLPWTKDMSLQEGKAAAYVCKDFACQAPVTSFREIKAILDGKVF
jgi:uncharacterized protein YyaL (SSP411 family)